MEHQPAVASPGRQPDPGRTAGHLVGVGAIRIGQRRQIPAQVDDIADALFPILEQVEALDQLGEGRLHAAVRSGHGGQIGRSAVNDNREAQSPAGGHPSPAHNRL